MSPSSYGSAAHGCAPRASHVYLRLFLTKNLQAQCMDVWCEAFCCRHINFKTVLSASEHATFIQKILKNLGEGNCSPTIPQGKLPSVPLRRLVPLSKIVNTPLISYGRQADYSTKVTHPVSLLLVILYTGIAAVPGLKNRILAPGDSPLYSACWLDGILMKGQ